MNESDSPGPAPWRALHTRSRSERVVGDRLARCGFEVFAAQAWITRQWSDRIRRVAMPLFPGYVFARVTNAQLSRAVRVPGVAGVVRTGEGAAVVRDEELEAVRLLVRGIDHTGELPSAMDPVGRGDRVFVTGGPFEGMVGILLEARGEAHVAIRIEALRQATAVRLDRELVAPMATAS